MSIRKLVTIMLLLGVTACGSTGTESKDDADKKVIVDDADKDVDAIEPVKCLTVGCEEMNKSAIEQIYNDVINGLNTGLVATLYAEDFIQHNPAITAGIAGQEAYFDTMTSDNPNHIATIKHIYQ